MTVSTNLDQHTMNTDQDELQTKLVGTMLAVMDLHEKFSKFGTKEITNAVETTVTSKAKKPMIITQLYKLETLIEELRTSFAKASMRALLVPAKEVNEDPVVPTVESTVASTDVPKKKKKDEAESVGETKPVEKLVEKPVEKVTEKVTEKVMEKVTEKAPKKTGKVADVKEVVNEPSVTEKPSKKSVKAAEVKEVENEPSVTDKPSKKSVKVADVKDVVNEITDKVAKKSKKVVEKASEEPTKKEEKPMAVDPVVVTVPVVAAAAVTAAPVNKVTTEEKTPDGSDDESVPLHLRRKNIPKHIKTMVWNIHMGVNNLEAKCFCCRAEKVDARNFQCGHVIAEAKGGDLNIKNLRPICQPCNASMGTNSMNEFTKEFFGWEV